MRRCEDHPIVNRKEWKERHPARVIKEFFQYDESKDGEITTKTKTLSGYLLGLAMNYWRPRSWPLC